MKYCGKRLEVVELIKSHLSIAAFKIDLKIVKACEMNSSKHLALTIETVHDMIVLC